MRQTTLTVTSNERIANGVYRMTLRGDGLPMYAPGQFMALKLSGFYLRRPISLCDQVGDEVTIIYKTVGHGTSYMAELTPGAQLDALMGLGNGYSLAESGSNPLLLGGGVGVPPLYLLAKRLIAAGKNVTAILGFNTAGDVFYAREFAALGCSVHLATADGSMGFRGFVTDIMPSDYTYTYACGPEPMLKAVYHKSVTSGQYSFEERMGCGFGACMGCTCRTITGHKRICKDGPVLVKEEILWAD